MFSTVISRRHAQATMRRRAAGWLTVAACTVALAACAPAGPADDTNPSQPVDTAAVAAATELLDLADDGAITGPAWGIVPVGDIVPWTSDLIPEPAPLQKGLKVDVVYGVPAGDAPYISKLIQNIGAELGWNVKIIKADDQAPAPALAAFNAAILEEPDAIISVILPGAWLGPALEEAKAKGISTINVYQDPSTGEGFDAWLPLGQGIQKAIQAAYAVKDSGGEGKVMLVDSPAFSDVNQAAAAAFLENCEKCEVVTEQIDPNEITNPVAVQTNVTNYLGAAPGTDYIIWPNGSLPTQSVIQAIDSSPSSQDAKLLLNAGVPSSLSMLLSGDTPLVVQAPDALLALAAIDTVNRLAGGMPALAPEDLRAPIGLWTADAHPAEATFPSITAYQLDENDFVSTYEDAWGVGIRSVVLNTAE